MLGKQGVSKAILAEHKHSKELFVIKSVDKEEEMKEYRRQHEQLVGLLAEQE